MSFYPGQIVGNYQIVELLGQGGMATVYKAQHTKLNRFVALKVMYQTFLNDPTFLARFEREAQIIARLDHPNIVPVHDYAEYEGTFYLVMKFIEGISLATALEDGPLELGDIRIIMSAISQALDYAHSQGVLHRDIKPSNIMLDLKGTPYLADFGLARQADAGDSSISQGMMVGTPAYMSPEQGMGTAELDSRSDIYSLGIVLYQLLVGRTPFKGGSALAIVRMHQNELPPMPSTINPEIPPGVEAVVLRAIAKTPDDRFDSAGEMYRALETALNDARVESINPFERHSIAFSLAQPREKSVSIPRDAKQLPHANAKPTEQGAPTRKKATGGIAPLPTQQAAQKRNSSLDIVLIIAFFAALIILIIVVVLTQLNRPTVVVPTAVIVPTLMQIPSNTPADAESIVIPTGAATEQSASPTQAAVSSPGQGGQTVNLLIQPGELDSQLAPLPQEIQLYDVPTMSQAQAQQAVDAQPSDPSARLALIRAVFSTRQTPEVFARALEGTQNIGERPRFVATLLTILQRSPVAPDVMFQMYKDFLAEFQGVSLAGSIREWGGARLYTFVSVPEGVPQFILPTIGGLLTETDDPMLFAMLANIYISMDDLTGAENTLARAPRESSEVFLVRGNLLYTQGDTAGARENWQKAIDDSAAPAWVRTVAERYLGQLGT